MTESDPLAACGARAPGSDSTCARAQGHVGSHAHLAHLHEHERAALGHKDDLEKLRYDLVPVFAEAEVVKVLSYGAKKYAPGNWRHVPDAQARYLAVAPRGQGARGRAAPGATGGHRPLSAPAAFVSDEGGSPG